MSRKKNGGRPGASPGPTRSEAVSNPCASAATFLGQFDEIAEAAAGVLDLRNRRPRFDREGRRLARVHSVFRPGNPAVGGSTGKVLPMVRLSGKWLRESGFPVGRRFSVEIEDGELVIRAL